MTKAFSEFTELMRGYREYGDWRIRRVGSREFDHVLKATLRGKGGTVEVWDGTLYYRREVYFIGKDGSETLIAASCYKKTDLASAIEKACQLAGIQRRLFADA